LGVSGQKNGGGAFRGTGKAGSKKAGSPGSGGKASSRADAPPGGGRSPRSSPTRPTRPAPVPPEAWSDEAAVAAGTASALRAGWREAIERTVTGLHFDVVDVERAPRGLLRITIDRRPGHVYPVESEFVIVEDCEIVTRQLQFALEVAGVDYARLEVSSPGLDRPLKREADYARFEGQAVSLTLKQPFEGRKVFKGVLGRGAEGGWTLAFTSGKTEQVLGFALDEVREARLVPVLDFKGRRGSKPLGEPAAAGPAEAEPGVNGG
jgi:ribosome maturation factor RimP